MRKLPTLNLISYLIIFTFFLFNTNFVFGQTTVQGSIVDSNNQPIPFANVLFTGSSIAAVSDFDGKFILTSPENQTFIEFSFMGYETQKVNIEGLSSELSIILKEEASELEEVFVYSGKVKKKGNPAIAILRKIWAKKQQNGTNLFGHYEYDKYEKVSFDMNNLDSSFVNSKVFKGIEFIFDKVDTSDITGKAYLPMFINESVYKSYGKNEGSKKLRQDLIANKNSGFGTNQNVISFIKDLYAEYNIYDNYIKIFDKSFVSPLSKTSGILTYNYVLADSAYLNNRWCYNIVYYPKNKNLLAFKGDFWVNDTTYAIKEISMQASKSANINWIKDLYIEQEFEVLNDSVFVLKKDYMLTDFSFSKKKKSKGMYGRRTTMYDDYIFDEPKPDKFYNKESNVYDRSIYKKPDSFWAENRKESLNSNDQGIYQMLDTLITVPKFKRIYNLVSILGSGYIQFGKFDFGSVYSAIGKNDVEGWRLRLGGKTFFGGNEPWRLQGFTAYGFDDQQFKYGLSGKWMLDQKTRFTIGGGNRRDVEQIGVSLTTTNNLLGRSFASSALFARGANDQLTSINLSNLFFQIEPKKNLELRMGGSYRTLKSASSTFNLDYYANENRVETASEVAQSEVNFSAQYTPGRKMIGYGVERKLFSFHFPTTYLRFSKGLNGVTNQDFDYEKVQLYYRQPVAVGGLGRFFTTVELGKTFGEVPLGLLNVVPGNQTAMVIEKTYNLLNYYEFVTDTYASMHLEHHFNGRIFSRLPLLKKLNLREIVSAKGVWGSISDKNINLNASNIAYKAPEDVYVEYGFGIGNIFKILRVDFVWRGTYRDTPGSDNFGIRGAFGFNF